MPHVASAEMARQVVHSSKYYPLGMRGLQPYCVQPVTARMKPTNISPTPRRKYNNCTGGRGSREFRTWIQFCRSKGSTSPSSVPMTFRKRLAYPPK